jgi:hypothetical protein
MKNNFVKLVRIANIILLCSVMHKTYPNAVVKKISKEDLLITINNMRTAVLKSPQNFLKSNQEFNNFATKINVLSKNIIAYIDATAHPFSESPQSVLVSDPVKFRSNTIDNAYIQLGFRQGFDRDIADPFFETLRNILRTKVAMLNKPQFTNQIKGYAVKFTKIRNELLTYSKNSSNRKNDRDAAEVLSAFAGYLVAVAERAIKNLIELK